MMTKFDYSGSTALVTGASRGIGAAIARELAMRGTARLILTARTQGDLETLAEELKALRPEMQIELIPADLADPQTPQFLKEETNRRGLTVDLLVNNAGFGSYGPFDTLDMEKESRMIQVNITALMNLTRLYLPEMLTRGRGGVLNVGSAAAFQPVPYMTTYAATKAFVQSFSEALWAELQDVPADVRVVCLCPGGTETNFGNAIGVPRATFEKAPHSTPEEVAEAGLDALDRGDVFTVVGTVNYAVTLLPRLLPRATTTKIVAGIFRPEERKGAHPRRPRAPVIGILLGVATLSALAFGLKQWRENF